MALGDKKPVVMEADLGLPSGPASLDSNGILEKDQWPGKAEFGLANLNLLHNWYFKNPVNTIGGDWIVPGGTPYYSDTTLGTEAGTVEYYALATYIDGVYGSITVEDVVYYVDWTKVVRGYTATSSTEVSYRCINRFGLAQGALLIMAGYVKYIAHKAVGYKRFLQISQNGYEAGKTYTASILARINKMTTPYYLRLNNNGLSNIKGTLLSENSDFELFTVTTTMSQDYPDGGIDVWGSNTADDYIDIDILAAKLEIGDTQTLAHQDENGKWILNEIPDWTEQYMLCEQYSNSSTTGAFVGNQHSNPNLLDNWYFPADSVIDQKEGYIVPPETPYYSDTGLATQAGTVSAYTTATYVDGVYGTVTVDSTEYYIDWTAAVRGYIGAKYGVDRWCSRVSGLITFIENDGLKLVSTNSSTVQAIIQSVETPKRFLGKTLTFSALVKDVSAPTNGLRAVIGGSNNILGLNVTYGGSKYIYNNSDTVLITATATLPESFTYPMLHAILHIGTPTPGETAKIIAAKLELGPKQTLAHLDADGNWVLNDPPPNKQQELAKCQRYSAVIRPYKSSGTLYTDATRVLPSSLQICYFELAIPVPLRAKPSVSFTSNNLVLRAYADDKTHTNAQITSDWAMSINYVSPCQVGLAIKSPEDLDITADYNLRITYPGYIYLNANL